MFLNIFSFSFYKFTTIKDLHSRKSLFEWIKVKCNVVPGTLNKVDVPLNITTRGNNVSYVRGKNYGEHVIISLKSLKKLVKKIKRTKLCLKLVFLDYHIACNVLSNIGFSNSLKVKFLSERIKKQSLFQLLFEEQVFISQCYSKMNTGGDSIKIKVDSKTSLPKSRIILPSNFSENFQACMKKKLKYL